VNRAFHLGVVLIVGLCVRKPERLCRAGTFREAGGQAYVQHIGPLLILHDGQSTGDRSSYFRLIVHTFPFQSIRSCQTKRIDPFQADAGKLSRLTHYAAGRRK